MQRVSTAQLADDMLNEFYVRSNLDKARAKHNKRVEKRLIQQGMLNLSPLKAGGGGGGGDGAQLGVSQSLDGPAWHRHGAIHGNGNTNRTLRPNSKTVRFGANSTHGYDNDNGPDDDISTSSLNSSNSTSMLLNKPGANPLSHHAVTDMMHRVTYQSGRPAGQESPLASPEKGGKDKDELDNVTIAANAREVQYQGMLNSQHMQQIMREILDLNKEVNELSADLAFRKELQGRLEFANTMYVRLFERMLAETLMLQRSKFKSQTKSIQELRALLADLAGKEQSAREAGIRDRSAVQKVEIEMATLHRQIALLSAQLEAANMEKMRLEDSVSKMSMKIEALSGGMSDKDMLILTNRIRAEARAQFMKELESIKKQWAKEAKEKEEELKKTLKGQTAGPSMADLTKSMVNESFKRPVVHMDSQTEVDECGVWDKQDGWTLPVSGTLIARQRWREAIKFAKCPCCRGVGAFIALTAKLLKAMQRGGGSQLIDDNQKPRGATGSVWQIPDELVRFMSNLPRSVMAVSPKPLPWIVRRVWHLLVRKMQADDADDLQGLPLQSVQEHLIEAYLMRSEKRSDAELELFVLLTTLKDHHHKHMLLHTFARFVGVLDGYSVAQIRQAKEEKEQAKAKKREKEMATKYKNMSARERTAAARAEEDAAREKAERELGKADPQEKMGTSDASLSLHILKVYHFARHCLLEPYVGGYAPMIASVLKNNDHLNQNAARLNKESDAWGMYIPPHVCVSPKYQFYLPLDRALRVTQAVICFLDEGEYNSALRALEHAVVFLNPDGSLALPEGMHTLIRSTVREFLAVQNSDGSDMSFMDVYQAQLSLGKIAARDPSLGSISEEELRAPRMILLVDMDVALRIICECLLQRTKYVETKLAEIFIAGDVNKDGVLSFNEFMSIVSKVAPHFSDRRILRMYREALSMGNDNDTIESGPFVHVCNKHGLVSLVDMRDLQHGSLRALCKSQEEKDRDKAVLEEKRTREAAVAEKAVSLFSQGGFRTPAERNMAKRNSSSSSSSGNSSLQGQVSSKRNPAMVLSALLPASAMSAAPAGMIGNVPPLGAAPRATTGQPSADGAGAAGAGASNNAWQGGGGGGGGGGLGSTKAPSHVNTTTGPSSISASSASATATATATATAAATGSTSAAVQHRQHASSDFTEGRRRGGGGGGADTFSDSGSESDSSTSTLGSGMLNPFPSSPLRGGLDNHDANSQTVRALMLVGAGSSSTVSVGVGSGRSPTVGLRAPTSPISASRPAAVSSVSSGGGSGGAHGKGGASAIGTAIPERALEDSGEEEEEEEGGGGGDGDDDLSDDGVKGGLIQRRQQQQQQQQQHQAPSHDRSGGGSPPRAHQATHTPHTGAPAPAGSAAAAGAATDGTKFTAADIKAQLAQRRDRRLQERLDKAEHAQMHVQPRPH